MSASAVTWLDDHAGSVSTLLTFMLVVVTILYARITFGLLVSAKTDRDDRRERELSEQARLIGGYLGVRPTPGLPRNATLVLTLVNASKLPVRAVTGRVFRTDTGEHFQDFNTTVVLDPGEALTSMQIPDALSGSMLLRVEFDDDAGVRWRKYESEDRPLVRVARETLPA